MKYKIIIHTLLLILTISSVSLAQNLPNYWNTIQGFKKQDSLHTPPKKAILFVGSSTFTKWRNMQDAFPKHTVINRGFGGSQLPDVKLYFEETVFPKKLKQIVIYAGDNDIAAGNSPEVVLKRFQEVESLIRKDLPKVEISFVSIKSCPGRSKYIPQVEKANALIKAFLSDRKHVSYIDTNSATLNKAGDPMKGIYVKDGVHLNSKGYDIWANVMEPYLK
ncbi:hypothetical protein KZP23_12980 [Echinicola marina]|uniref:GDSL-type esterase/lipase family protein n=1 Tax=Echinicola marina TaxID=2859768 RepID=UPI001CF647D2|nr:GDSL-type esterase/lipase family protein [Echinicola marina]UCS91663.1 hypothetical protein KZP23_12980 [Echinicola marina]